MKKTTIITLVVVAVIALVLGRSGCSSYNSMVALEQDTEQAQADMQTQYQRRFDLIPNLVETVKGYAKHESETYEKVTQARAGLTSAYNGAKNLENSGDFAQYAEAQTGLNRALSIYVNAVKEAYPDLKANEQFLNLQTQLEGTENRIATARVVYNEKVKAYNLKVKRFPSNLWAGIFGFAPLTPFQAEAAAQSAPKVSF